MHDIVSHYSIEQFVAYLFPISDVTTQASCQVQLGWLGGGTSTRLCLAGLELFWRETRRGMWRSLTKDVVGHLDANDLKLAYRALKKLRPKSTSRVSAIRTADDCLVSDADGQMTRWAEYFEQLFKVNPPRGRLQSTGSQVMDADPPINQAVPSIDEVKEAVARWRGGKAAAICNISAELQSLFYWFIYKVVCGS